MNGSTTDASSSDPAFTRGISVGTNGVWYECQASNLGRRLESHYHTRW